MTIQNNSDGLAVQYGRTSVNNPNYQGETIGTGHKRELVLNIDIVNGQGFPVDGDNDGTGDRFSRQFPYIPAGSAITKATLVVTTAFAGGTNVNIGLAQESGTVINSTGIDAAVLTAALAADKVVNCDGTLVGGTATIGSADGFVYVTTSGTYTAGVAKLVIEYIKP